MASKRIVGGFLILAGGSALFLSGISGLSQLIYVIFTDLGMSNFLLFLIQTILQITLGCLIIIGGIRILSDTYFNDLIPLISGFALLIWGIFYEIFNIIELSKILPSSHVGLNILTYIVFVLHAQVLVIIGAFLCYKNQYDK